MLNLIDKTFHFVFYLVSCRYWRTGIQAWVCSTWSSLWYRERTAAQDWFIFTNSTWHCVSWLVPCFWWGSVEVIQKSCHPNSLCWVAGEECGKSDVICAHKSVQMLMFLLTVQNAVMLLIQYIKSLSSADTWALSLNMLWLKSELFRFDWYKITIES